MTRRIRKHAFAAFRRNQRGIASVEFALLLPVLVLLLFGTVEIGRMVSDYHAVAKGVRDAARYLSRVDGIACPAASVTADRQTEAAYMAMAGTLAAPADGTGYRLSYWTKPENVVVTVACVDNSAAGYTGIYTDIDGNPLATIPEITVTANVPFVRLFGDLIVSGNQTDLGDVFSFRVSHSELHFGV